MKKIALLAAFAATTMLASPVMAGNAKHSDSKANMHSSKKAHHSNMKQSRAIDNDRAQRRAMATQPGQFDDDWDAGWDQRADNGWSRGTDTGFFPLDLATGVTAGAIGTAGAIAGGAVNAAGNVAAAPFEPFRDDWSRGGRDSLALFDEPYAVSKINGPTCQPGTWTTINGTRMRCQ